MPGARDKQTCADGSFVVSLKIASLKEECLMLRLALAFFVVALIAALFGYGGIAAGAASIAQFVFFLFVVLFVIALVLGLMARPVP
jgi:uncharacterized membrane protein YtjA (UPF0391 family)